MKDASPYDQFSTRRVREIYPRHTTPVYSDWRSDNDFINDLVDGFSKLAAEFSSKKRKVNDTGRGDVVQYASDNIQETLDTIRIVQDKMKGTPQCFSVTPKYGAEADQLVGVWIAANNCPSIRVTRVCKDAETLNYIASRIQTMPFEYHGESYAAFGENLRLALCKHHRDISQNIKDIVLARQDHRCTLCCEVLEKVEYNHRMPLADGGGHGEDNIQALCPPCHANKSRGERLTTFANAWYSELSRTFWKVCWMPPSHSSSSSVMAPRIAWSWTWSSADDMRLRRQMAFRWHASLTA